MCQSSQEPCRKQAGEAHLKDSKNREQQRPVVRNLYNESPSTQGGTEPVGWADILGTDLQTCSDPQLREQFLQKEATLDWVLK